jgi:hypothetical protein
LDESDAMAFHNLDEIELEYLVFDFYMEWNWIHCECTYIHQQWNKIDLDKSYIPIEEEIIGMLDERDDATNNDPLRELTKCKLVIWW